MFDIRMFKTFARSLCALKSGYAQTLEHSCIEFPTFTTLLCVHHAFVRSPDYLAFRSEYVQISVHSESDSHANLVDKYDINLRTSITELVG